MTEARVKNFEYLVRYELRRFRDHEDFEDICQEAWIAAWYQGERLGGKYADSTIARVAARTAFTSWIRSRKGRRQWRPPGRKPPPEVCFFDELPPAAWPESRDPALQIVERLGAEQQAEIALAAMTERQRRSVRDTVMGEAPLRAAAKRMGVTSKTVWVQRQAGLKRARFALLKAG